MTTYHTLAHSMLQKMLGWYIGVRTDYSVSCGKLNKYFKTYLPEQVYLQYCETYPDSSYANFWSAIDASCALFHQTAQFVAEQSGYVYPQGDEDGFRRYAEIIQEV